MIKTFFVSLLISLSASAQKGPAEESVKTLSESKDGDARWQAARRLGELKFRPAIPLLIKSLSDPHHYVRANAARALSDMNADEARGDLVKLLDYETDGGVIQQATLGIRKFQAREALPALRSQANHDDTQTRIWVLQTISQLGSIADVACIASYLEAPVSSLRSFAAEALGSMTHQSFAPESREALRSMDTGDADRWWSEHKSDYPNCYWGLPTQERAITTLLHQARGVGTASRTKELIALLDHDNKEIRIHAIQALRREKDPEAIPAMVKLLDDPDPHFQYDGVITLCEMNTPNGTGCPSTLLFRQSPKIHTERWKDWWKQRQDGSR